MADEVRGLGEVQVIGDVYPVKRIRTGLWSLDRALRDRGDIGLPLRSLFELYGFEHSGKSTLAWYLAARVKGTGTIWIADLEGTLNKEYVRDVVWNAGFRGTVRVSDYQNTDKRKRKMRSHEEQMQDAIDALKEDDDVHASVVDSIGMMWPIVDTEKDLGERTVGQRAKTVADATRRVGAWLRITDDPKLCIWINHVYSPIGGRSRGYETPGGWTKKYGASIRVWLQRIENDVPKGTGNFIAEAKVQKLKWGGAKPTSKGLIYFIPGYGVSKEMTDVFDCVNEGLAKREATIKLKKFNDKKGEDEWVSMGRLGQLVEKAWEPHKHKDLFKNFSEALQRHGSEQ